MKTFLEIVKQLNEGKVTFPDPGETVQFEDRIKTKVYKDGEDVKGKPFIIEPSEEFEVISSDDQIILKTKDGIVRLEKQEYKDAGGALV